MEISVEQAVRAVDLFARLDGELHSAVGEASHVEAFTAGGQLVAQCAAANGAWIVLDGEVEPRRNGDPVASYGSGKMVGDLSLLSGTPHLVDAIAMTDGGRLVLGVGEFRAGGESSWSGLRADHGAR